MARKLPCIAGPVGNRVRLSKAVAKEDFVEMKRMKATWDRYQSKEKKQYDAAVKIQVIAPRGGGSM